MVAVFLRGELGSERWSEALRRLLARDGRYEHVVQKPDLTDDEGNEYRSRLLEEHRAWERREGLFLGFPRDVVWWRAALAPEEALDILFVHWDWWLRVSAGSRRPREAASLIREHRVPGVSATWHEPLAAALRSIPQPPELIAVATPRRRPLVLLEGHVRLTAYALFPEYLPPTLEVLLGISEDMPDWCMFRVE